MSIKRIALVGAALLSLALTGCSTESMYGVSKDRWAQLEPNKKHDIATNYLKIMAEKRAQHKIEIDVPENAPKVAVNIHGGSLIMPPFKRFYRYEPIKFTIKQGTCQTVKAFEINGEHNVDLEACYKGKVVSLDPSHIMYKYRNGTAHFEESPIWKRGFKYEHITTHGFARLRNATVEVKKLG